MSIRSLMLSMMLALLSPAVLAEGSAPSIAIGGAVEHPRTLTIDDLRKLPATVETVFLHTGSGTLEGSFTGVALWKLLQDSGIKLDPAKKNDAIRHAVVITGTDGYGAVLSLGEIDPEFGGDQAIVAYEMNGKPLDPSAGYARLVIPTDKSAGRSVSAIATIEIR